MDTFVTALGIVVVMMMGCALWVLVWDAIDKKTQGGINLGNELHQKIVNYLIRMIKIKSQNLLDKQ